MPATLISHYRLARRLGSGGMGEVFLAHDTRLERLVALKIMSPECARDPEHRKRFHTEATTASRLAHPNICAVYEIGATLEGRPFLAMEFVQGQPLNLLTQQRKLTIREIIHLGIQAAEALHVAHSQGMVHRDVKPTNLMVDEHEVLKVMDFGVAKCFAPETFDASSTTVAHTRTGISIGTPPYMSPEQALGHSLDPRTDLFSLGVVLYELITGQRPFHGHTAADTINNIINQPAPPLGLQNPQFSPALDNIIFKCLEKNPEKRYPSAKDLATALTELKEACDRARCSTSDATLTLQPRAEPAAIGPSSSTRGKTYLTWAIALIVAGLISLIAWLMS